MNSYMYSLSRKFQLLIKFWLLVSFSTGFQNITVGQIANAPKNTYSPWVNGTYTGISASIIKDVPSLIPLCLGSINSINNLTDANTSNSGTISITGAGCSGTISVKDINPADVYPAGTWAGFRIDTDGLLGITLGATVTIRTFLNGTLRESYEGITASLRLNSNLISQDGSTNLGFVTSMSFNEIQITYSALLGVLFTGTIYHAVIMRFEAAPNPTCGLSNPWRQPTYPVQVSNSGFTGVTLGTIANPQNVIDPNINNYATISLPIGILATGFISVKDQVTDYPAGLFAGFEISNSTLIGLSLLNNITITTYLNGTVRESKATSSFLIDLPILTGTSRQAVGFYTQLSFDEIRVTINQPAGLELGSTLVYAPIISNTPLPPTSVSASNVNICPPESSTLSATCINNTLHWYSNQGLTLPVNNNPVSPISSTTYYAVCKIGSCNSQAVSVTVNVCLPDISPTLNINNLEFLSDGGTRDFIVTLFEVNGGVAQPETSLSFKINKIEGYDITYSNTSGNSNIYDGVMNSNGDWNFTEDQTSITVTAKNGISIPSKGFKIIGFNIKRRSDNLENSTVTLHVNVGINSSGEETINNNTIETYITAN